mmetsp:Transcript_48068/g.71636  ORF Transcript_48068/g.71636 Transcript_48068/m.71636 type:complete len:87 (-) Transcript_48068:169-429(-)
MKVTCSKMIVDYNLDLIHDSVGCRHIWVILTTKRGTSFSEPRGPDPVAGCIQARLSAAPCSLDREPLLGELDLGTRTYAPRLTLPP